MGTTARKPKPKTLGQIAYEADTNKSRRAWWGPWEGARASLRVTYEDMAHAVAREVQRRLKEKIR